MMKTPKQMLFALLLVAAAPVFSQTGTSKMSRETGAEQQNKTVHVAQARDGQKVFEQNCSRCHNTPQGFSPRISGTIVRHMRVRAGLSREDEQAVLRFLNP